ncbi:MAG: hypothetical protein Q7U57_14200 [Methylovulum sp.]|nr:hypothetical protein [Methylovulum sp.]
MNTSEFLDLLHPQLTVTSHKKGETLTANLAASDKLFYVRSGCVLLRHANIVSELDRQSTTLKHSGEFIGLDYIFKGSNSRTSAKVWHDSQIASLRRSDLMELLTKELAHKSTEILGLFLTLLSEESHDKTKQIEAMTVLPSLDRMMFALQDAGKKGGSQHTAGVVFQINSKVWSDLSGVSYDTGRRNISVLLKSGRLARVCNGFLAIG